MRATLKKYRDFMLVALLLLTAWAFLPSQSFFDRYQIPALEAAATKGDISAQSKLADRYYYGVGVPKDVDVFLKWANAAAAEGDPHSQVLLAYYYFNYPKNYKEGLHWAQKAVDQEWPRGERFMGWLYSNGVGVDQDDQKAVEWWIKAANHGDDGAARNLARTYARGAGFIKRNEAEAIKWWGIASSNGDRDATWRMMRYKWKKLMGRDDEARSLLEGYDEFSNKFDIHGQRVFFD